MTRAKPADTAEAVALKQRRLQQQQDRKDAAKPQDAGGQEGKDAVQAGAREHPAELPAQHLAKPGNEHEMQLKPQFLAPDYKGSGKLDGMAVDLDLPLFRGRLTA